MKMQRLTYAIALVAGTVVVGAEVVSQKPPAEQVSNAGQVPDGAQVPDAAKDAKAPVEADDEALIDNWVRHAMPGEQHKLLGRMTGRWDMKVKYWMNAAVPAVESEGVCVRKWILGKRFVLEEFDGGNLALPFEGLAIYGYDAFEKKYTSVWVDSMSTAITTSLGACVEDCARIRFVGRHGDPWSGTKRDSRGMTRFVSEDEHVLELHEPGADGKEFKMLEITYTRATDARPPSE